MQRHLGRDIEQPVRQIVSAHQAGRGLALVFDYDGTLALIAAHPSLAALAPGTRRSLEDLVGLPRVVVGVISGRTLADLKELVGLPGICYAGTSGLELEMNGALIRHPEARAFGERVESLSASLEGRVASVPGAWIERKAMGLTVHYRGVAAERVPDLRQAVAGMLQPAAALWRITEGPMAIEVTPGEGWRKSTALRSICELSGPEVLPLYAGDHANDADALEAAAAMGGIAIGVGAEAPSAAARFRFPDPAALADLLSRLAAALKGK